MSEDIDTTAKDVPARLPGRPGVSYVAGGEPEALPAGPPAAGTCRYYLSTRNAKVYALELREGWIPVRGLGSVPAGQLAAEPHELDWSAAFDARGWNTASLVPLCDAERAMMAGGRSRAGAGRVTSGLRTPLPKRRLTDAPRPPETPVPPRGV